MSGCWLYPLCASAVASASLAAGPGHFLAKDGRSAYRIVVAEKATPADQLAASELQSYVRQATGAELPLVPELRALISAGEPSVFVGGGVRGVVARTPADSLPESTANGPVRGAV